jgi:hypothetical protein
MLANIPAQNKNTVLVDKDMGSLNLAQKLSLPGQ